MSIPAGDVAKGEKLFKQKCTQCHVINNPAHKQGPSLQNLLGRTAGTVPGYSYTDANKNSGIVWSDETLFAYLENPKKYIKGTKMAFPGFKKPQDRADVVAYVKSQCK